MHSEISYFSTTYIVLYHVALHTHSLRYLHIHRCDAASPCKGMVRKRKRKREAEWDRASEADITQQKSQQNITMRSETSLAQYAKMEVILESAALFTNRLLKLNDPNGSQASQFNDEHVELAEPMSTINCSPFFRLPRELRDLCYHFLWEGTQIQLQYANINRAVKACYGSGTPSASKLMSPRWLRINQCMREEALEQFYRVAKLRVLPDHVQTSVILNTPKPLTWLQGNSSSLRPKLQIIHI